MAREFEIKLEIPASTVGKVMRLPWLWELASGELQASHMRSTYYDTPKNLLRQHGITLRVRRIGAVSVQTVKAAVNGAALPIERDEWEGEVAGDAPELRLTSGTPLDKLSRKKLERELHPRFELQTDRSAFPIQSANSAIEVAIDRGAITGFDATTSFCEVELELKRGASSELARIARRIASEVPASLVLKTKADRGFALRDRGITRPHQADPVAIMPSARVGESFQAIGWSCLRHFALNADAVLSGDTRGVHQMRVGIRRLGAAISLFKHLLDGPETDAVKAELKWLTGELAPARALDVFLESTLAPLSAAKENQTELAALREDAENRRQAALGRASAALSGERYRQLALRTALWLIAAEWSDKTEHADEQPSRRIGALAVRMLTHGAARVVRKLGQFERLGAHKRHQLRLAIKKHRYATEFFADVFPDNKAAHRDYLSALEKLQDDLGQLNDIAGLESLREDFMAAWTGEQPGEAAQNVRKAFAMGFAIGQQQLHKDACVAAVAKERRRLSALQPFWR